MSHCITTDTSTVTPADNWVTYVDKIVRHEWSLPRLQFPLPDQAGEIIRKVEEMRVCRIQRLIERRYQDFADRVRNVANLIIAVKPLVMIDGQLNADKYKEHLHPELRRELPFLEGSVREGLALRLISECPIPRSA